MISFLILIALFFLYLSAGVKLSGKNLFAPAVLTSGIWIICLLLFLTLDHDLPPFSSQFTLSIIIWVTGICISSLFFQSKKFSNTNPNNDVSYTILNVYFLISILSFPFLINWAIGVITSPHEGISATQALRQSALGLGIYKGQQLKFFPYLIWNAAYIIELCYFKKTRLLQVIILGLLIISYGVLTMSKFTFLMLFINTLSILSFRLNIKLKHIIIGSITIFLFIIIMQILRENASMSSNSQLNNFLVLYAIGHISAFDTLEPMSAVHFGENTFRSIYAILNSIGVSDIEPTNIVLPWIKRPILTNTYTGMYPYFVDFGYLGVFIFSLIIGSFMGFLFGRARRGSGLCASIFAVCSYMVVFQYQGDFFFTNLAGNIKLIIVTTIPFIFKFYKRLDNATS